MILDAKKSVKFRKWFISLWYILSLTYNWLIDYSVVKFCVPILTQYRCLLEAEEWFCLSLCWFSAHSSSFLASSFVWSLGFIYCVVSLCITIFFLPPFFSQSRLLFATHFSFFCWSGVSAVQSAYFDFGLNKFPVFKKRQTYTIWGPHSCGYKEFHLRGYNAMYSAETQPTFRYNMNARTRNQHETGRLHTGLLLSYIWTLKMEAWSSSVTTIGMQRTTRIYVHEDSTIRNINTFNCLIVLRWSYIFGIL